MDIPQRKLDDVLILEPAGRMTIGEADYALKQAVNAAAADDVRKLVLNLASVTYMDSAALGELLSSRQTMSEHGGKVRLCCLQPRVKTLLEMTGLLVALDVHETEAEAIQAFQG
jgi:stage II sporulation protein AA (anti-sigma F factor antagonist)